VTTIPRIVPLFRAAIAAYEASAVDISRAFDGSRVIGCFLAIYYLIAFVVGLGIGAAAFELLGPILDLTISLPLTAGTTIEIGLLTLLLFGSSSITCFVARLLLRAITYLCFEMRGDRLFYMLILLTLISTLALVISALLPPVVPEHVLTTASGVSAAAAIFSLLVTAWLYFRYRRPGSVHEFDRDVGLAWSHMTDPRRTRFSFGRRA
jgi:hypothetical protein